MSEPQKNTMPIEFGLFVRFILKPHLWGLFAFFVVAVVWAIELSLSPYLLKLIIDTVNENDSSQLLGAILPYILLYGSLSFIMNINFRVYDYVCLIVFPKIKSDATNVMFDYLSQHSHSYFLSHFSGSLANKIMDMARSIEPVIKIPSEMFVPRALALVVGSIFLWTVSPLFSLILIVWSTIYIYMAFVLAKHSSVKSFQLSESGSVLTGSIVDSVTNMISAKIFANIAYEKERIKTKVNEVINRDKSLQWYLLKAHFYQSLSVTVLIACMLALLVYGRLQGWVTIGDFALVLTLAISFVMQIDYIGHSMLQFSKDLGVCRQALSIIAEPHDIKNQSNAKPLIIKEGRIQFSDVTFKYSSNKVIFNHLNVTIMPGEKVGLVGFSGGGKSTFVKLVLRLYDVSQGKILIDDQDIKEVTKESLRSNIGMIPQEPDLFHRSIMDNIRYGRREATDADVIEAAKRAHADDFIKDIPEQYHALVGERGIKLSGGQRQRIAIARAILKNAPILILDEATSQLDSVSEGYIQDSLWELMQGKTTLIIAHRLSTLLHMDRILVFDKGCIVQDGSHDSLLKSEGMYKTLWDAQVGGFILDSTETESEE